MPLQASFEWDNAKDRSNRAKHGVPSPQRRRRSSIRAALSPRLEHSGAEPRYFCFGAVGGGVMTVRFTYRQAASASSAPAIGGKERESMSNRTVRYTAGEIGRVRVIDDFLPAPADLVPREENVKVTLSLSRRSLDFFKREAKKRRVPYQRMIRALVDTYADRQAGAKK